MCGRVVGEWEGRCVGGSVSAGVVTRVRVVVRCCMGWIRGIKATIRSGSDDGRSRVTGRWPRCLRSVRIRVQEPRPELGALVGFEPSAVHVTLAVDAGRKREARALRMPLRGGTRGGGSGTRRVGNSAPSRCASPERSARFERKRLPAKRPQRVVTRRRVRLAHHPQVSMYRTHAARLHVSLAIRRTSSRPCRPQSQ